MENKDVILTEIEKLKRDRNAIFLVHNYQRAEVQDIADFVGDSLGLAQEAAKTDADVVVLCGVMFMAETAKLLNPTKTVLLPVREAGCPMADMVTADDIVALRREHPDAVVVSYVNTSAATKAVSDICCTSANAVKVINTVPAEKEIIFTPDKNLGAYIQRVTGRRLIIWPGCCPTHERITPELVRRAKKEHPRAEVVVHPECVPEVIDLADAVRSTSGMLDYCASSPAKEFIIGTEKGMLYPLRKRCPDKVFWPVADRVICPNMKMNTLAAVRDALRNMTYTIEIPEEIATRARGAIEKMVAIGRGAGS